MTRVVSLASRGYGWTAQREEYWGDYAACGGMNPNIFYGDHPDYDPVEAKKACDTCPVFIQCLSAIPTDEPDTEYVFRAGEGPGGVYPSPAKPASIPFDGRPDNMCKLGHLDEIKIYPSGNRVCLKCKRDKAARKRLKDGKIPRGGEFCQRGHSEWKAIAEGRRCQVCHRERDLESSRRRRSATIEG